MADPDSPIGIFDSGVGGLTVLRAVRRMLPSEPTLYLGDTARVPYGTKSPRSVERYAHQAAAHLVRRGIKLLVVACNTASTVAVDSLRGALAPTPVIGVVEPGAQAAVAASRRNHYLVLATEGTVRRRAYTQAIQSLSASARVEELPCSLFVALAEEGWAEGPIPEAVAREYLTPVFSRPEPERPDCVILGCTHFPLLASAIHAVAGPRVTLVDSATATAERVAWALDRSGRRRRAELPGSLQLIATDDPGRFARVGSAFLGEALATDDIEVADL